MNKVPKCPYCGNEMMFRYGHIMHPDEKTSITDGHYVCDKCLARTPEVSDMVETADIKEFRARTKIVEKALAAALHRAGEETEQGNRVLTFDEVATYGCLPETVLLWVDDVPNGEIEQEIPIYFDGDMMKFLKLNRTLYNAQMQSYLPNDYGVHWRCWLRKPTAEELKRTPWRGEGHV